MIGWKSCALPWLLTSCAMPVCLVALCGSAQAQSDNNQQVEEVVVTGSAIPTAPDAVAVNLSLVDSAAINAGGVNTNVLDILRKQLPSFVGRSNAGSTNANNLNQNTAGGSQILLNNLDTLILINGRRAAVSAISGIGGKNFVDVNEIPAAAIERVEVLNDGSSAIYGSDAIGGVVNIILKSDVEGVEAGTRFGGASGGYGEESGYFVAGTTWGDFDFTFIGSRSHSDPLFQDKRDFASPITGRVSVVPGTIGGASPAILATGLNSPSQSNPTGASATALTLAQLEANGTYFPTNNAGIAATYDLSQFQTLVLGQDQTALDGTFTGNLIGDALVVFGDAEYSQNTSFTQFLPITTTVTVPGGAPFNPLVGDFAGVNFADWLRPKKFHNDEDAIRGTIGLRGHFFDDWDWEVAFVHSENTLDQQQKNVIYKPNIPTAIAGGYDANGNLTSGGSYSRVYANFSTTSYTIQPALDPFARADGLNSASLANLYGTEHLHAHSDLDSLDAKVNGYIFDLPAGRPAFAIGGSWRREGLSAHADADGRNTGPTAQLWLGGTYADPFSKSRTVSAGFLEVRVPVTSEVWNVPGLYAFDLVGAAREERYSDAGSSFVPKISFRWQPFDRDLTIRAGYSKSFTAPTLFAQFGPTDTRIVGSGVIQSVFGLNNPGLQGEDGNNSNLKPSKAQDRTVSATYSPQQIPGLVLTAQYSSIDQRGFPGGIGFTNILDSVNRLGSASPFSGNLAKGNFPGLPGATPFARPGDLLAYLMADPNNSLNVYAIDRFTNLGGVKVRTFTFNGSYSVPTEKAGDFTLSTTGTYFDSYQFQALPSQKFYEYAGTATNGGTGVQGTIPRYRFYSTLAWNYQGWTVMVANTYVSGVKDLGPGGIVFENSTTLKAIRVASYTAWDARLSYDGDAILGDFGKGWTFAVGVNDFTDAMPPRAAQAFNDNNADVATYSPLGRFVYTSASVKF